MQDKPQVSLGESIRILFEASRGFWLVNLVNFGDGIAYFGMLALMTLFMERDVGLTTNGATMSISFFSGGVTIFMALGGGYICDRLGVRRAFTFCLVVLLIGRVLLTVSPAVGLESAWLVAALSLLFMAFGEGVIQPTLYAGVKEYTDTRTATLGYAFLYSIMNLGIVAGEALSPLIRDFWAERVQHLDVEQHPTAGIAGAFWFFVLITAGMLVMNLLLFTRRVEERDRTSVYVAQTSSPTSLLSKLRALPILDARFGFFIFILLPVRTLFAHQFLTMPHFVTRAFDEAVASRWEWINGLNPLVIVIFVPLFAMLTRKVRVVDMMIVGTAVSALATFMMIGEPNTQLLLAYVVVFSLGEAMWSSRFLEYVADIAPARRVGLYMGIAGIPWFLAKATTGTYAGAMIDIFVPVEGLQRPGTMWLIYGLVALISPIGLVLARNWLIRGVRNEGVGSSDQPSA